MAVPLVNFKLWEVRLTNDMHEFVSKVASLWDQCDAVEFKGCASGMQTWVRNLRTLGVGVGPGGGPGPAKLPPICNQEDCEVPNSVRMLPNMVRSVWTTGPLL